MPPRDTEGVNGWSKEGLYVRKELERLSKGQESLFRKLNEINVQIAMLKVKSGIWGAVGAMIPIAALLLLQYVKE